ncbi:MAG TPA: ABC transporter substrate-binding protein, partial [Anaerolineae bacterium]|nr:ABC transporter substrate-binding protein [Anaerolineae bacterium]
MIYIGMDDTDNAQSRGTGHIARAIAKILAVDFGLVGVVRHQLLFDPRIRYTAHNSSKSVILDANGKVDLADLAKRIGRLMLDDFQEGSDPGVCVARDVPEEVVQYGRRAQQELITQDEARALAAKH